MGYRRDPSWDVRFSVHAATAVSAGPKRPSSADTGNRHYRGGLGVYRSGTHNLSSQEIASRLAKFIYDRASLSKPPVASDRSGCHNSFSERATHFGLGADAALAQHLEDNVSHWIKFDPRMTSSGEAITCKL